MNIYEKRLKILAQTILFLKRIYKPEELIVWIDIRTNRIGVPQRLWSLRKRLNLSEEEFAISLGLNPDEYKKYEHIGVEVPDSLIERICEKYRIERAQLRVT